MKRNLFTLALLLIFAWTCHANDHASNAIEARLQKTYDSLRAKLDAAGKQRLKEEELAWIEQTSRLKGADADNADLDRLQVLSNRLAQHSSAEVRRAEAVAGSAAALPANPTAVASAPSTSVTAESLEAPRGQVGTGTIRKGAVIADTPEHRKQALDFLFQKDEASFAQLIADGSVIVMARDTQAYWDGVDMWKGLDKVHFAGAASMPFYVDLKDFTPVSPK